MSILDQLSLGYLMTAEDNGPEGQFGQFNYGEELVLLMLKSLTNRKSLQGYKYLKEGELIEPEIILFDEIKDFQINQPLDNLIIEDKTREFNKLHNIDIALVMSNEVYPIEVKLGTSNACEKFPLTFYSYLAGEIKTDEGNNQFSNNMIKIMDQRKSFDNKTLELKSKDRSLHERWSIVIRNEPHGFWKRTTKSQKTFKRLEYVFVFDEMWRDLLTVERKEIRDVLGKKFSKILDGIPIV